MHAGNSSSERTVNFCSGRTFSGFWNDSALNLPQKYVSDEVYVLRKDLLHLSFENREMSAQSFQNIGFDVDHYTFSPLTLDFLLKKPQYENVDQRKAFFHSFSDFAMSAQFL